MVYGSNIVFPLIAFCCQSVQLGDAAAAFLQMDEHGRKGGERSFFAARETFLVFGNMSGSVLQVEIVQ